MKDLKGNTKREDNKNSKKGKLSNTPIDKSINRTAEKMNENVEKEGSTKKENVKKK